MRELVLFYLSNQEQTPLSRKILITACALLWPAALYLGAVFLFTL